MSRAGDRLRLRRRLGTTLDRREPKPPRFLGILGKIDETGEKVVSVSTTDKLVYVRIVGRGVVEALNLGVVERFGVHVIVGYSHERPEVLQVLGVWTGGMVELGPYSYLPHHYQSHEFRHPYGGDDWVPIQKQAIVPMVAHPTKPRTMTVEIEEDVYAWADGWVWWGGATSADLGAQVPAAANQARFVTITIDGATELLQYEIGDLFNPDAPPVDRADMIPAAPLGSIPIVAVYLPGGTTTIEWDNLFDIRLFNQPMGGSLTPGPHGLLDSVAHDDTLTNDPSMGSLVYGITGTYGGVTGTFWSELPIGTTGTYLRTDGFVPFWDAAPAGGGAPTDAQYVVVALNGVLTQERVLTEGDGITIVDGGANGNITINVEAGTPDFTLGLINAEGATGTFVRTDASIALFDAVVPTTIQCDDAAAAGVAAFAARRDHTHGIICFAPDSPSVSLAASTEGTTGTFARSDHTHQLNQTITPIWLGAHTHRFNVTLDDNVGDSPSLIFINQSNQEFSIFGEQDNYIIIKLADDAGGTKFALQDSAGNYVFSVDSDGNIQTIGLTVLGDDLYLEAYLLHLDGDGNTYFDPSVDDVIDLYIGAALDFSWTANSFNVLASSVITYAGILDLSAITGGGYNVLQMQSINVNGATVLRVMPDGTPAAVTASLEFFGTDFIADAVNYERLSIRAWADRFTILTDAGGTGTINPLILYTSGNANQLYLKADGNIGIGTAAPLREFHIAKNGSCEFLIEDTSQAVATIGRIWRTRTANLKWYLEAMDDDLSHGLLAIEATAAGVIKIPSLAGAGNRPVMADLNGVLSA